MGYSNPPWEFKGQALYQLSLVKIKEARKYVPAELPLVNFFGWTLGGFYLARYSHSPVGAFDELVALAGLVWDFPTSCAWAARVYVNNKAARDHGISSVGLPSRLASFKAVPLPALTARKPSSSSTSKDVVVSKVSQPSWWDVAAPSSTAATTTAVLELKNLESRGRNRRGLKDPVCEIVMPSQMPSTWAPKIQMALPSFSGATPDFPGLLKYSLRLMTKVRFLKPVQVRLPQLRCLEDEKNNGGGGGEVLDSVLGGRPLLCMAFDDMEMQVQPPEVWSPLKGRPISGGENMI